MNTSEIPSNRPTWLAIIVLAAVIVAAVAGFLLFLAHAATVIALAGAGTAFIAATGLGMNALRFLAG